MFWIVISTLLFFIDHNPLSIYTRRNYVKYPRGDNTIETISTEKEPNTTLLS